MSPEQFYREWKKTYPGFSAPFMASPGWYLDFAEAFHDRELSVELSAVRAECESLKAENERLRKDANYCCLNHVDRKEAEEAMEEAEPGRRDRNG